MLYGFWRLQVRGRHPTGEALEREDIRMRHERCLAAFLGVLLWGATGRADITMTTPYDYDDPNGRWVFPTTQDIAYPCPNAASNITGINSQGPGFKIGAFGDDPAGSGQLPCTNP